MHAQQTFDAESVMTAAKLKLNLARTLCLVGGINPHGQEIIALIGGGDESSNLEALGTWVTNQVDNNPETLAPMLADEIETKINAMSEHFQNYC